MTGTHPAVLTVAEVAAELRLSTWTVRQLVDAGRLRRLEGVRVVRITRLSLEAYLGGYDGRRGQ